MTPDEMAMAMWDELEYDNQVQWFAKKHERRMGGRIMSPIQFLGAVRNARELGWDFYLQLNPSRARSGAIKLSREDIIRWGFIVVDIDPVDTVLQPPMLNPNFTRVFTGRGYQCLLPIIGTPEISKLPEDVWPEDIMRGYLRMLNRTIDQWAPGYKVDTSCADLARVVRCPGTINQKSGRMAVYEFGSGKGHTVNTLLKYRLVPEPVTAPAKNTANLSDIMPHLTVTARRFILDGVETPGRHSAVYHTAKLLRELGVSYDKAMDWMYAGGLRCRPSIMMDPKFHRDLVNTVKGEYGISL
jgi:hypothetical protein